MDMLHENNNNNNSIENFLTLGFEPRFLGANFT